MTIESNVHDDGDIFRAQTWGEFQGQVNLKARLSVHINAAKASNKMLPHVLLDGPAGTGKTTLAQIIANELGDQFTYLKMSTAMDTRVLENIIKGFEGGVLFLDEIHCASKAIQHELLTLLQSGFITTRDGRRLTHKAITVIGATTEPKMLLGTLRDRFTLRPATGIGFDPYTDQDMEDIIFSMAWKAGLEIESETGEQLARATGGTPRLATQFIFAGLAIQRTLEQPTTEAILHLLDMDADGLDRLHMLYLRSLDDLGGVAGLDKLANMTNLDLSTIKDLERLLLTRGFVVYGAKGRELTQAGLHKARGTTANSRKHRVVAS